MGKGWNKIYQLRSMTEYCPPNYDPIKHPTRMEMMDKLNEVIRTVNFIIEHYLEEGNEEAIRESKRKP